MRKLTIKFFIGLLAIFSASSGFGQANIYTIGATTGTNCSTCYPTPFANWFWGTRQQYLYLGSELTAAGALPGNISQIGFTVNNVNSVPNLANYTVYIKTSSTSSLNAWEINMGTPIYGPTNYSTIPGLNTFNIPNGLAWNGSENIIIEICSNNSSYLTNGNASVDLTTNLSFNGSLTYYADNANNCGNPTWGTSSQNSRPVLFLSMENPLPNNVALINMALPLNPVCQSNQQRVEVNFKNAGTSPLDSCTFKWQVHRPGQPNPFPLNTTKFYGPLQPDSIYNKFFIGNLQGGFIPGDSLTVYSEFPNGVLDSAGYNDTIRMIMRTGIAGNFTIGYGNGSPNDFPNFTTAINYLDSLGGICDSVVFTVNDSIYNEQLVFSRIEGASKSRPIVFKSASGNPGGVVISFVTADTDSNFTVLMNNAQGYKLKDLTIRNNGANLVSGSVSNPYGTVVLFGSGSSDNVFKNVIFRGMQLNNSISETANVVSSTNSPSPKINNEFRGCSFYYGTKGLSFFGGSSNNLESGNVVANCNFINQYYSFAHIKNQRNLVFINNQARTNSAFSPTTTQIAPGYFFESCNFFTQIIGNSISTLSTFPRFGLYLLECNGTATQKAIIANNIIAVGQSYSSDEVHGIYLESSNRQVIAYNNTFIEGNSTVSSALKVFGGGSNDVYNNNFYNDGNGLAVDYVSVASVINSDNNNLYVKGNVIGKYQSAGYNTLAQWIANTGYDATSLNVDPLYHNPPTDLHVCNLNLESAGKPVAFIQFDIDNDIRNQGSPDIGADEFTPVANFTLGSDSGFCFGDSIFLQAGLNYGDMAIWNQTDTSTQYIVTTPGPVYLSLINKCGVKQDTINYIESVPVKLSADTNICADSVLLIHAGNYNTNFIWNNGDTRRLIEITAAGVYSVTATDQFNCESIDEIVVTQSEKAVLIGDDVICGTDNPFLSATPNNALFNWSTGSTANTIAISSGGTYWVQVNDDGCITTDTIEVRAVDFPVAEFTAGNSYYTAVIKNTSTPTNSTFHWDFGDGNTSSVDSPNHIYATSGTYTITLIVTNECGADTTTQTFVAYGVGISEVGQQVGIQLFPNPTTELLNLNFSQNIGQISYTIIDINGKPVISNKLATPSNNILNVANLATGIYTLQVITPKEVFVEKLLIE